MMTSYDTYDISELARILRELKKENNMSKIRKLPILNTKFSE